MDYSRLIPETAPEDLFACIEKECERFRKGVMSYRAASHEEAEAAGYCEDFGGDYRRDRKKRPALLWCSECGRESVAEWISAKSCHGYGLSSGIGIEDDFNNATGEYQDGAEMHCPACGENVTLKSATAMNHGHTDQTFITVPTVCGSYPVFTVFCAERRIYKRSVHYSAVPFEAYVIDGKKVVKLVAYRRGYGGGWYSLGGWQQLSRAVDTMCAPIMYWQTPDLSGTVLENAKLWDYKAQAYESGLFFPLAYSRLYLRHRNVENLITAGLGKLIGSAIEKGAKASGYYGGRMECPTPNITWIDWKQAKPAKMLGVTKEQLRWIQKAGWKLEEWEAFTACKEELTPEEVAEAFALIGVTSIKTLAEIQEIRGKVLKTARYLRRQNEQAYTYRDYIRAVHNLGEDVTQDVILWPPRLRAAHDRVAMAARYTTDRRTKEQFEEMSRIAQGLTWKHNGIIIRPAATPEELVQEGATLKHCVGGYAKSHASGRIILFIRHERRPERSWYTLNVDLKTKKIIQNHGYRNEMLPNGTHLRIPKEVQDFVLAWTETILNPWVMPKKKQKEIA